MAYVAVPAEQLFAFLEGKGFTRTLTARREVVYERRHARDPRYVVLVYTSVRDGATQARGRGRDAIRVCAVVDEGGERRGVAKLPRVHRTGEVADVLGRVLGRAREAYAEINRRLARHARHSRAE